jgi:hypothetical protein
MNTAFDSFLILLGEAWTALASALVILAAIGLLAQALRAGGSAVFGLSFGLAGAIAAFSSLALLGLYVLLGVPALVDAVEVASPACGPLAALGEGIARLIAAFAGLRLLVVGLRAITVCSLGGGRSVSESLVESGEAVLGMLLATAAAPVAAHFLGVC